MPTSARQPPGPRQSGERTQLHPCRRGGLYIRPVPGASATGPGYIALGSGRAMRAPTVCAVGDGASDASVRRGGYTIRPYGPAFGPLVGAAWVNCQKGKRVPGRSVTRPQAALSQQRPAEGGVVGALQGQVAGRTDRLGVGVEVTGPQAQGAGRGDVVPGAVAHHQHLMRRQL